MAKKDTILIVDDTQTNIDILIELLGDYDIIVATDGKSALEILDEEDDINLILLDIMMPVMDGFEVCKIIKKDKNISNIPIIFLTAKTDDNSIQKGFELGGVDYVTKPFRPIELLSRIKTHLKIVSHEKKSIQHNKYIALAELIHNIAHQWRQPLSVISTSASGISMQKELNMLKDEDLYSLCDSILHNTEYLSSTIDNFKNLIDNTSDSSKFNLNSIIQNNQTLLFCDLLNKKINLEINVENDIVVDVCQNQFIQVLLTIITNSKDVLDDKDGEKYIFIDISKNDRYAMIKIYDNGEGIKRDIIDKIFEPYFTTKHQSAGKGLGLYIVRNIVIESFDGLIEVTNKIYEYDNKKQKGGCFEIQIPLS